jgi:NPCBM/NEW2 domain-containing protein
MYRRTLALGVVLATALSSATALASAEAATTQHDSAQRAAHSYRVVAKVNKTDRMVDDTVKIKAKVTPAAPGASVTLQLKYDDQKKWKTVDHGRLNGQGKVTFKDKLSSPRVRKYRVVKPADSTAGAGNGETEKVFVFGWRDLTSIPAASAGNMSKVETLSINGVAYPSSVHSYVGYPPPGNTGSIEYNLNRGCKAFRGTVGLDDSSPASGTATIQLSTDGAQRYSGSFALTQSAAVAFDVTNVFRLSIATTTTANGSAAVGTPQVLCSF